MKNWQFQSKGFKEALFNLSKTLKPILYQIALYCIVCIACDFSRVILKLEIEYEKISIAMRLHLIMQ